MPRWQTVMRSVPSQSALTYCHCFLKKDARYWTDALDSVQHAVSLRYNSRFQALCKLCVYYTMQMLKDWKNSNVDSNTVRTFTAQYAVYAANGEPATNDGDCHLLCRTCDARYALVFIHAPDMTNCAPES